MVRLHYRPICLVQLANSSTVKVPREQNALPEAAKIILCACRNGFKMAHADPVYQLEHLHKTVPWSEQLLNELTRGLQACRVL